MPETCLLLEYLHKSVSTANGSGPHNDVWTAYSALQVELARLQAIVDRLPKTADGVLYSEYRPADGLVAWCLFRYDDLDPWVVSQCHFPADPDEHSLDFALIVEDAEDECMTMGPYSTQAAAKAAQNGREGDGDA